MMSEGTKNIVNAMKARGITKVIGCMSGIEETKLDAFYDCIIFCDAAFMCYVLSCVATLPFSSNITVPLNNLPTAFIRNTLVYCSCCKYFVFSAT